MILLYTVIFVTGGAVLALELLASRILTPYFGVSLYIWTGILSITLVSLALGYWGGGRLARRANRQRAGAGRLVYLYFMMPATAAIAIVAACLVYPYLFARLADFDLILGAFAASLILLAVPLAATAAMNPLLVAIFLLARGEIAEHADAGAGKVFFVSTIGSVAGVLVTAFVLIPHLSNFVSALLVALTLAALSLLAAAAPPAPLAARRPLAVTATAAVLCAGLLLWLSDAYTGRVWPVAYGGHSWRLEARYGSLFGTVKILRSAPEPGDGGFVRMYFQDGLVQNTVASDGRSMSFYTYALEALAFAYRPELRSALVLGLGAGIVPMRLAQRGVAVEAVEIDPVSFRVAREFFGFDPAKVRAHQADARTFLRGCKSRYDAVVIDLFHGDGVPDYLVTRDFFRDLRGCLRAGGVAVFNTFADLERPRAYAHFLTTLRAEFPAIVLYRPDWPGAVHVNSFVVAGLRPLPEPVRVMLEDVPALHARTLPAMLDRPQPLDQALLAHGEVVTDARNTVAHDIATSQLVYRRAVVEGMPPAFLLN